MELTINVPVSGGEARIVKTGAIYTLIFDDIVANNWEESYATLPLALARLATLVACADEVTYGNLFAQKPEKFVDVADHFFRETVCD